MSSSAGTALPALGSEVAAGDDEFERILKAAGTQPIVVDFYAEMLAPLLKKVVASNKKTFLVKVDVDEAQGTAAKFEIASLPTVAIFQNGKMIDKFVGLRPESAIRSFVEKST
ncbi:hypothetical protein HKX48_002044 [Thoreauomyces humboldtii]|nr:hypothetical protein HKX48_002044 [Thoreauomyces humboldtii]